MKLTLEIFSKFFLVELGDLYDDEPEDFEYLTLPMGFLPPPDTIEESDDGEYETPEVDRARGARGRCKDGAISKVPKAAKDLRGGRALP